MRTQLLSLFLVLHTCFLSAQVFEGFKEVYSQSDVNELGAEGYTAITQGLFIRNSTDITDLTPLSSITSVGALYIGDNEALSQLTGLQNITEVTGIAGEGVYITRNARLADLSGLRGIRELPQRLYIEFNPSLRSVEGLNIRSVPQLAIIGNNALENLNGLENLTEVTTLGLSINSNPSLIDITGLQSLLRANSISFNENNSLVNLNGLQSLTTVDQVGISGNPQLTNYCGLTPWATANPSFSNYFATNNAYNPTVSEIISTCDVNAPTGTTTIPDPNFEQALIDLGYDTGNPDGTVPTANIESAVFLPLRSNGITDLTGIADFKALENLDVYDNAIANVDVSQNTNLLILDMGINMLTQIDLYQNSNLNELYLDENRLTSLDISALPNLRILFVNSNPELSCITVANVADANAQAEWFKDATTSYNVNCDTPPPSTATIIPDPNFEQALIDLGYDVGPINGSVPTANIQNVQTLDVFNRNISDLTGIEDFTSVTFINANSNNLTRLDISENLNLESIGLNENNITELDISANTNLIQLEINDNDLSALDLSQSPQLETLLLSNNPLANGIDLGNLPNLRFLFLTNTGLSSLDLSNNPNLEFIRISGNPLLSCVKVADIAAVEAATNQRDPQTEYRLDCDPPSATTTIPDPNFEQALIDLGYDAGPIDGSVPTASIAVVTDLNVVQKDINSLEGIQDFTSLENLSAALNQLSSVDLSNNSRLTFVELGNNQLTQVNLSGSPLLTNLNLYNNNLQTLDISNLPALVRLAAENNALTELDISQNPEMFDLLLTGNPIRNLNTFQNPRLLALRIGDSQIEALDLSQNMELRLLEAPNGNLNRLNLKNGNNTILNGQGIVGNPVDVSNNPNLSCIQVDNVVFSENNPGWIKDATASYSEDCSLTPAFTTIPDPNFEQALIDSGYDIGPIDGTIPTANIQNVQTLDVFNRNISDLAGIEDFTSVTFINANSNNLTRLDISENLNLESIGLNENNITELNISANTNLVQLEINDNDLSALDLSQSPQLETLLLSNNPLANGIDLGNLPNLRFLFLTNTGLSSLDLSNNPNLEFIRISGNPLLSCVKVGDIAAVEAATNQRDPQTEYRLDCDPPSATTAIPDPNFEQALIDLGYDIGPIDGIIPTANIIEVTRLVISQENINSLEGIQDFANLEELYSNFNSLETLDLSQNAALRILQVGSNQLTSLNLTQNVNLDLLLCDGNELPSLNVSQNTMLRILNCGFNQITSLDVSNNTLLTSLNARFNQLAGLDLSQNPLLEGIVLDRNPLLASLNLRNGNNSIITGFDASVNPNLSCIQVDDVAFAENNPGWTKDATTIYRENCDLPVNNDADGDGVLDADDLCPDTAPGLQVSPNGCALAQLADLALRNIAVSIGSDPCGTAPDGNSVNIEVLGNASITLSIIKDATENIYNDTLSTSDQVNLVQLTEGEYELCVSIPSIPNYAQCYQVNFSSTQNTVSTNIIVLNPGQTYPLTVSGNTSYDINVNGLVTTFDFNDTGAQVLDIPLVVGNNAITISGSTDCGGNTTRNVESVNLLTYPNPTNDVFTVDGLGNADRAQITVQNASGTIVYRAMSVVEDETVTLDIGNLNTGLYFILAETKGTSKSGKIMKR
ncbi:T9SS type A sorting domain-containing protein [Aggregatimonas sangjinii]|uniref:T9SS type A sorting domain-containing protein n=1 Tax=Aggregatimonas sangjinii TaxID=2583587 RepID=A0A5B7STW5_9FLAO|nr:T9SS type A sorting domain-containing protein [Aggregatimonas sangjinii]QCX01642.1 T9SS type A sorting domain-containing protein [Aggregatimonas sangjinii]